MYQLTPIHPVDLSGINLIVQVAGMFFFRFQQNQEKSQGTNAVRTPERSIRAASGLKSFMSAFYKRGIISLNSQWI